MKKSIKIKIRPDDNSQGLVGARPYIKSICVLYDNYDIINTKENLKEKLHGLGVKPGVKFYILKADKSIQPRNNFDAVWDEDILISNLRDVLTSPERIEICCSECGDGVNIVSSFIVTENYHADFN